MTQYAEHLQSIGRTVLNAHAKVPGVQCAAIIGSCVDGHSDEFSDLDMVIYYNSPPSSAELGRARESVPGAGPIVWTIGAPNDGEFVHAFKLDGIECQIAHVTVARWEADLDKSLRGEDPGSPNHKALSGTLVAIPVVGKELMDKWKAHVRDYPEALRIAMVNHHLKFFPMWAMFERFDRRDANLWIHQSMVESSFNILGALAGLNRKYFTSFQFKRAGAFIKSLKIAPPNLAARLDALWMTDVRTALSDLKELVRETIELIEQEMPQIDTTSARKSLMREDKPWTISRARAT